MTLHNTTDCDGDASKAHQRFVRARSLLSHRHHLLPSQSPTGGANTEKTRKPNAYAVPGAKSGVG